MVSYLYKLMVSEDSFDGTATKSVEPAVTQSTANRALTDEKLLCMKMA